MFFFPGARGGVCGVLLHPFQTSPCLKNRCLDHIICIVLVCVINFYAMPCHKYLAGCQSSTKTTLLGAVGTSKLSQTKIDMTKAVVPGGFFVDPQPLKSQYGLLVSVGLSFGSWRGQEDTLRVKMAKQGPWRPDILVKT